MYLINATTQVVWAAAKLSGRVLVLGVLLISNALLYGAACGWVGEYGEIFLPKKKEDQSVDTAKDI